MGSFIEKPHTSQRKIERETGMNRRNISRKKYRYNLYRIQLHDELYDRNFQQMVDLCLWALERFDEDENFIDFVMFSDESTFHNNNEKPRFYRTLDHQIDGSINGWRGILRTMIISRSL